MDLYDPVNDSKSFEVFFETHDKQKIKLIFETQYKVNEKDTYSDLSVLQAKTIECSNTVYEVLNL
jgi:hypothetical protein